MSEHLNPQEPSQNNNAWQQQTIEKLALSGLKEQKTARRWSIFFKSLTFLYLFILLIMAFGWFGGKFVSLLARRCHGRRASPVE